MGAQAFGLLAIQGAEAVFDGVDGRLGAIVQVELGEDIADVGLDGLEANIEAGGDLFIA